LVEIQGKITVDPGVNKAFMLNKKGHVLPWDGDQAHLVAFENDIILEANRYVPFYTGPLNTVGLLKIAFGYRLSEGTVVHNAQTIDLIVTP